MAERVDDQTLRMAVAAAVAASGQNAPYERVMALIPQVTIWLTDSEAGPMAFARQVAEAEYYSGVLHSTHLEERTKRLIITTVKNDAGETEEIRTNPIYTPHGKAIADAIKRVEAGTRILIWKTIETSRNDATKKVRVAVHFKVLPARDAAAGESGAPRPPQQADAEEPRETSTPPAASASNLDPRHQAIRDNIRAAKDPIGTAKALRDRWGTVDKVPEEELETALFMSLHEGEEPFLDIGDRTVGGDLNYRNIHLDL